MMNRVPYIVIFAFIVVFKFIAYAEITSENYNPCRADGLIELC